MNATQQRLANLQAKMSQAKIDLAAIGSTANLRYFLGFAPHADERLCLLLVDPSQARMVVPFLNSAEIAAHTDAELVTWTDTEGPLGALGQALGERTRIRSVAVDGAMRADSLLHLQAALDGGKMIALDGLVTPLRQIKSTDEIDALAKAAAQADRAMAAAVEVCRVGATESEVAWAVESAFRKDGAETVDFTLIAAGPNGAFPHHHSGETRLKEGDAIIIDIGATLNGYKSDITRMVYLGKPTAEFLTAYTAVREANQLGVNAVRPGITAEEVDRVTRNALRAAGLGQYFTHRTGHGIGLEGHEAPWIMEGSETVLQPGMAFSIEPGVYFVGRFGIRIEDIVVVTESGVRNLTGFDHSLVVKT